MKNCRPAAVLPIASASLNLAEPMKLDSMTIQIWPNYMIIEYLYPQPKLLHGLHP